MVVADNDNEREDGEEDGRWAYQHHYGGGRSQMSFLAMSLFAFCILAPLAQYYSLVCCNGDRVVSSRRLYINPASRFNLSLRPTKSTLIKITRIDLTTANFTNMSLEF